MKKKKIMNVFYLNLLYTLVEKSKKKLYNANNIIKVR